MGFRDFSPGKWRSEPVKHEPRDIRQVKIVFTAATNRSPLTVSQRFVRAGLVKPWHTVARLNVPGMPDNNRAAVVAALREAAHALEEGGWDL